MHACGDTMLLQLYLIERADPALRKKASFVGEVLIKWKHCLDEDTKNKWQHQQLALSDEDGKATDIKGLISTQLNVEVRYLEAHLRKPKGEKYGDFKRKEEKFDLRKQEAGAAGTLYCCPKAWDMPVAFARTENDQFNVQFVFEGKENGQQETTPGMWLEERK